MNEPTFYVTHLVRTTGKRFRHAVLTASLLLTVCLQVRTQDRISFFFNEFSGSVNRTVMDDSNTNDRLGFGLGIYRSGSDSARFSPVFGVEFNRTSQFKEQISVDHLSFKTDMTYHISTISIPVVVRFRAGRHVRLIIDAGVYLDLCVGGSEQGTFHSWYPGPVTPPGSMRESMYDHKTNGYGHNYGPSGGAGVMFPLSGHHIIIKADYKYGLNSLLETGDQIYNRYVRVAAGMKW
ncbi:MAG: outer membrane beta-barrel protein [Bacteroidales bacterium]|nr:outer membrane beta-barrel protein [Bacteroidales bacterium]